MNNLAFELVYSKSVQIFIRGQYYFPGFNASNPHKPLHRLGLAVNSTLDNVVQGIHRNPNVFISQENTYIIRVKSAFVEGGFEGHCQSSSHCVKTFRRYKLCFISCIRYNLPEVGFGGWKPLADYPLWFSANHKPRKPHVRAAA